jgi:hypothetical protein
MSRTSSRWRRPLRAAAAIVLFFACLFLLLALADLGPLLRAGIDRRLPALAADLGLRVDLGPLHLRAWPSLRIEARDLAIRPLEADLKAAPLFSVDALRADLAVWPLLRAGHLHVRDLRVEAPVLRLVRGADGRWVGADALARLQALQGQQGPPSQAEIEALAHLVVDRAALDGGAVLLPALPIRGIRLALRGIRPGAPFSVEAGAAVSDPGAAEDVQLALELGPLAVSEGGAVSAPPRRVTLRLKGLQIAPLLALLLQPGPGEAGRLALAAARLSGELGVRLPAGLSPIEVDGVLDAQGMMLGDGAGRGRPMDGHLRLQADLRPLPLPGAAQVKALDLSLGEMGLSGTLALRRLWLGPEIDGFSLRASGVTVERVLALLPPAQVPDGAGRARLRGPVSLRLSAQGRLLRVEELRLQTQGGTLDAGGSSLDLGQLPPRFHLRLRADGVDLQPLGALVPGWKPGQPALDADIEVPALGRVAAALARALLRGR